jgi:hypothetical protein
MARFFILVSLFIFGCAPKSEQILLIGPEFSEQEISAIYEAAAVWEDAVQGVEINVRLAEDGEMPNITDHPVEPGKSNTYGSATSYYINTYEKKRLHIHTFKNLMIHELAHYLGAKGHPDDGHCTNRVLWECAKGLNEHDIQHVKKGLKNAK